MSHRLVEFSEHGIVEIADPALLEVVPGGDPTVNTQCNGTSNDVCANVNPVCGSDVACGNVNGGCGDGLPGPGVNAPCVQRPNVPCMGNMACTPQMGCHIP